MKLQDLIDLVGLKSSDDRIIQLFEQYQLGNPPKSITANQMEKGYQDKTQLLQYTFKFNIANDNYYPPVSLKNSDYKFVPRLSNIAVFSKPLRGNKSFADPKPLSFWEDFIHPGSSFEECLYYFGHQFKNSFSNIYFQKPLNDTIKIKTWFSPDKKEISAIEIAIIEASEIYSHHEFNPANKFNTVTQCYFLLVKWLFDNKYLKLQADIYSQGLGLDQAAIQAFTEGYLKNHIWDTQIEDVPYLRSFLFKIASNSTVEDQNGERINFYIKNLCIKVSGQWDAYQKIYNEDILQAGDFERGIFLDPIQCVEFLAILTEYFALFSRLMSEKNKDTGLV